MDNYTEKILDFIKKSNLGVVSTINQKGMPESAVVAISQTEDLELIFGTFSDTRKYSNLQENQNVSIVIGWDPDENITIQFEGQAIELEGKDLEKCREIHVEKNPESKKYSYDKKQRFFLVKPRWIRYSDLANEEILEVEFDS